MKQLEMKSMLEINGGQDGIAAGAGLACGIALAWPIGTLIAGPTCIGLTLATILQ